MIEKITEHMYVPKKKKHYKDVKIMEVLKNKEAVYQKARRLSPSEMEKVNIQISKRQN